MLKHESPAIEELCTPRFPCVPSDIGGVEQQADAFSFQLLTPDRAVRKVCDTFPMTLSPANELSLACWVSMEGSAVRIAETTNRICAAIVSDRDRIVWAVPSRRFIEAFGVTAAFGMDPSAISRVDPRSHAARILNGEICEPDFVPATAWIPIPGESPLFEHSIPGYLPGTVLTMISAPHREVSRTTMLLGCMEADPNDVLRLRERLLAGHKL